MEYRKKPVVIEAFRFKLDEEMPDWFLEKLTHNDVITHDDGTCFVSTLEGTMEASLGDYIIRGVNGELYPCKPDIFAKTYTSADKMSFAEAYAKMKAGHKVTQPNWSGYWAWEDETIMMYTKSGGKVNFFSSLNPEYTLDYVASDEFELATMENCPALRGEFVAE